MKYPTPLTEGATIGLVAPSSPFPICELAPCLDAIISLGYRYLLGESVLSCHHGYLSGSDQIRANDLNTMFRSRMVDAIFCMRGGFGGSRILEYLDYDGIGTHPKPFIGYSDATAFHLVFHRNCDLVTFHGPMVCSNMAKDFDPYSKTSLLEALSMPKQLPFHNPDSIAMNAIVPGTCTGRIIGGCLSLVTACIGTFYQPDFTDKVLFLEDIGETIPRVDRMMQQLKHAGILSKVAGIALGAFTDCENPYDSSYGLMDFLEEFFHDYEKPVLANIYSSHKKPMGTIPFGTICERDASAGSLTFFYE